MIGNDLARFLLAHHVPNFARGTVTQELGISKASLLPLTILEPVQFGSLRIDFLLIFFTGPYFLGLQCHGWSPSWDFCNFFFRYEFILLTVGLNNSRHGKSWLDFCHGRCGCDVLTCTWRGCRRLNNQLCIVEGVSERFRQVSILELQRKLLCCLLLLRPIQGHPLQRLFTSGMIREFVVRRVINDVVVRNDFSCLFLAHHVTNFAGDLVLQHFRITKSSFLPFTILEAVQFGSLRINLLFLLLTGPNFLNL
mmetsp:Transcript_10938/g.26302  ORF Transcript_10938/g.26302 Transcript_10938/m.26302 type:complete len:252 (-) Transcript_10938:129-884(-)